MHGAYIVLIRFEAPFSIELYAGHRFRVIALGTSCNS